MEYLKNAVVLPLIKNIDSYMDRDILKNLKFCTKLIERVVSIWLHKHMTDNDLLIHQQHGYKKGHSSETLLLKVVIDLLKACDNQQPTIVMLLDLSATFNTVDQSKLLDILKSEIGIVEVAFKWLNLL